MDATFSPFAEILIYITILMLTFYGIALWYHLFTFGESKAKATQAVIMYVVGSIILVAGMTFAFSFI